MRNLFSTCVAECALLGLAFALLVAPRCYCGTGSSSDGRSEDPVAALRMPLAQKAVARDEGSPGAVLRLKDDGRRNLGLPGGADTAQNGESGGVGDAPFQEKPDLTVLDTWIVPGSFCRHAVVDLHSTIKNLGTVAVVDSFYFDMWFDGDNIGFARIESLGAGATVELVLETFPWPGDTLSHAVTAMADTDHEIDEESEVNNIHLEYFAADMCTVCTEVSLPFDTGWNWFSLNVSDSDMSLDYVLASLDSNGVYIKNQTTFAEYVPDWNGWFGTLTELSCHETYMIKMGNPDTLDFCGFPYDVSTPMELPGGWSWISYLPQVTMSVNDALGSLEASGEYIKNQTAFAEYVPDWNGWFGTLVAMYPCDGYKIKMVVADTLVYPDSVEIASGKMPVGPAIGLIGQGPEDWVVNPHDYETNGCLIAEVHVNGEPCVAQGDRLGAFYQGECRGVASSMLGPAGSNIFYLTVFGRGRPGEVLGFRYRDSQSGMVYDVAEEVGFLPDLTVGRSVSPFVLNVWPEPGLGGSTGEPTLSLVNWPEPFTECTALRFRIGKPQAVTVEIYNVCGERVTTLCDGYLTPDSHILMWDGTTDSGRPAPSGIYFCRLAVGGACLTEKMVLMR